ncbi:hypothetical protein [Pontibacter vulgaris]|uniref:hypothetical protein n=1 Tax=Pontibacter vulgaris TaxID=2905679 RepID=UPI001FA79055|nr:hypothetical protein [Pontibacter vulgaris]
MKKPSLYTSLIILSFLIAVGTLILRISHEISSTLSQLLFALALLLQFIARRFKVKNEDQNA